MTADHPSSLHVSVLARETSGAVEHEFHEAPVTGPARERLYRAAVALDSDLIAQIVRASVDDRGVASTWDRLVRPVWECLGSIPDAPDGRALAEYLYIQRAFNVLANAHEPHRTALPALATGELP